MLGSDEAIVVMIALAAALTLLIWSLLGAVPTPTRSVTRSFWCPFLTQDVTVEFQEDLWDGKRVAVNRCTAFSARATVACEQGCLRLPRLPSTRTEDVAA